MIYIFQVAVSGAGTLHEVDGDESSDGDVLDSVIQRFEEEHVSKISIRSRATCVG